MAHPQIAAFARLAEENSAPTRLLAGQKTLLSRTMHDIRYDEIHDELFVTNPFANAILAFRGDANGEEAPIRVIQGPNTQLLGNTDRLEVDPVHNEIFIPLRDRILVYPRTGNGDVAPIRVIRGPATELRAATSVAVDRVRNLLVVGRSTSSPSREREISGGAVRLVHRGGRGGMLIFNRTDNGNVKPRAVIYGPKTEIVRILQLRVHNGWIVASQPGRVDMQEPEGAFVGIWSIYDNGDVPPRWKIGGPKSTLKKPRGIALNPKDKELIVADMRLNAVLTFYFPEIF